jgi:PAS domain S-box-containing protein
VNGLSRYATSAPTSEPFGAPAVEARTRTCYIWRYQVSAFYRQRFEEEQQRQALAGHYEHLTRFGNDAILLLDDTGAIVDANDRATDYLLYTRAELLEMNVRQLRDPETIPEMERAWQTLQQEHRLLYESRYRRKDGSSFPVEISARTMDVGDRTFVQGIVRDITGRKQAEEQIRRVNRANAPGPSSSRGRNRSCSTGSAGSARRPEDSRWRRRISSTPKPGCWSRSRRLARPRHTSPTFAPSGATRPT